MRTLYRVTDLLVSNDSFKAAIPAYVILSVANQVLVLASTSALTFSTAAISFNLAAKTLAIVSCLTTLLPLSSFRFA